jgi:trimeric autotransporter adhesin
MRFITPATVVALLLAGATATFAQDITISPGVSVGPGQSTSLPVTLTKPAPRVIYVSLASSDPSTVSVNPANILFLEGATTPTAVPQVTGVALGSAAITASSYGFASASQSVQVNAALSFGPSSQTIAQGSSQLLFLTLSSPAPTAQTITITSDNPGVVSVPPTVTIPANGTFAQLTATAVGGGTTVLHATGGPNIAAASVNVTVVAPAAITLAPVKINLGQSAALQISLGTPAASGGVSVTLSSSDTSRVTISSASVFIPAGGSTAQTQINGVNIGSATVTASASGYASGSEIVPVTATLTFSPQNLTLAAGTTQVVMLGLSAAAPPDGFLATLSSDNPGVADLQHTVGFFPDGSSVATNAVVIRAIGPGTTIIHASAPPFIPDTTMSVTVVLPGTITLPTNLSIGLTQSAAFPLQLGTAAPPSGLNVTLSSSDPAKVSITPAFLFIPGGSTVPATQPQVTAVSLGSATIHAAAPGFAPADALVTVSGAAPSTVTATGGTPQSTLINTAFASPLSATVTDTSNNPVAGVTVTFRAPANGPSGIFAGGQSTVTATTNAAGLATSPVFIANGTLGSYTVSAIVSGVPLPAVFLLTNATVTMGPIILPGSVSLAPGQSAPFPISLGSAAPGGGVTITLTSSDPSKITITPSSIFIAGGATVPLTQPQVNGITFGSVTINASAPGFASATQTAQVTGALNLSPSDLTISGTGTQNLILTLSVPAPAAGFTINIASSNPGVATVPATVTFAANATTVVVPVTGVSPGPAVITASSGTASLPNATANVTVKPAADILVATGVTVGPGQSAQLTVSLNAPATRTLFVTLSSSDTSKVLVNPVNVIVLEGTTVPTLQPQVTGVDFGSSIVTASAFGLTGDSETVRVAATLSFGVLSQTIPKGSAVRVFLSLSAAAPADQIITLSSDDPHVATVPSQVTIPANTSLASVLVTGVGAGSTIIHATGGQNVTSATLTAVVVAQAGINLSSVNVGPGQTQTFPVSLSGPAPSGGVTIALSSSNSAIVTISPASIFIPGGSTTPAVQPQVTGVTIGSATITASASGFATATQIIAIGATLTFSPQTLTVVAGSMPIVLLKLSTAAPPDGFFAILTSDNPAVAQVQGALGFFPDGSSVATNAVVINANNPGTTVIHASAPPFIADTTLTITVVASAAAAPASQK